MLNHNPLLYFLFLAITFLYILVAELILLRKKTYLNSLFIIAYVISHCFLVYIFLKSL